MRHRIARWFFEPLLRFLRRRPRLHGCRCLNGPTVHHTGSRPPRAAWPAVVPGIGIGSCGVPAVGVKGAR